MLWLFNCWLNKIQTGTGKTESVHTIPKNGVFSNGEGKTAWILEKLREDLISQENSKLV